MPTGIVLTAGRSTRFGDIDKAFATFQDRSLLGHVLDGVSPVVDRFVVSCRRDQIENVRSILEPHPTAGEISVDERLIGPLGGIADGLSICESEWVIVVGCDFPFVDGRLFDGLKPHGSTDAVVPRTDEDIQPLCARYRTRPTSLAVQSLLEAGTYRVKTVPETLTTTFVDVSMLPFDARRRLQNINTKSDLERLEPPNRFS